MKIIPNSIDKNQNLSFKLRLDIQFDKQAKTSIPLLNIAQITNGIRISDDKNNKEQGLDMDFEIERTSGSEPSLATITIWNLSNDTFNQIANKSNKFELYYSRGGEDWSLLFRGTPYFSTQTGASGGNNKSRGFLAKDDSNGGDNDVATTLTLFDSLHSFESATISKSYQGSISSRTIILDCVTKMGVSLGDEIEEYPIINNYVARGSIASVLNEVCGKIGCKHIVDNGVLHLFNGKTPKVFGYLFNGDNSSKPEKEQDDNKVLHHFTTQLLTNLRAGQYCKCEFDTLTGIHEIDKVILKGNNYGTEGIAEVWVK